MVQPEAKTLKKSCKRVIRAVGALLDRIKAEEESYEEIRYELSKNVLSIYQTQTVAKYSFFDDINPILFAQQLAIREILFLRSISLPSVRKAFDS